MTIDVVGWRGRERKRVMIRLASVVTIGLTAVLAMLLSSPAFAHLEDGQSSGFLHGLSHPLSGLDHILAMVMVGIVAAQLGGRSVLLVPASFALVMILGSALAVAGIAVPLVETAIALSVVALGAIAALGWRHSIVLAMALVAFFAIFHGYAHGGETPSDADRIAYGLGFVMATTALHLVGIGTNVVTTRATGSDRGGIVVRSAGGGVMLAGIGMSAGLI